MLSVSNFLTDVISPTNRRKGLCIEQHLKLPRQKKRMIMKTGINQRKSGENQLGLLLNTHNKVLFCVFCFLFF